MDSCRGAIRCRVEATVVSEKVRRLLFSKRVRGEVLGVYRNSCNVKFDEATIVNFGNEQVPLTPKSVRIPGGMLAAGIFPNIRAGDPVHAWGEFFLIPRAGVLVSCGRAAVYCAKPAQGCPPGEMSQIRKNLVEALSSTPGARGIGTKESASPLSGYFLSRLGFLLQGDGVPAEPREGRTHHGGLQARVRDSLRRRADDLLCSLRGVDWEKVRPAVKGLLGLGPGLTPSGDDFLAGLISAGVALSGHVEGIGDVVRGAVRIIGEESRRGTSCVSVSMLEDAADGDMSEHAGAFLDSALRSRDANLVCRSARRLFSVGASSGVDLANGLATGILFFINPLLR
ncbi:MAG: DUF2877 domain-containing protein [Deltaproteobacteria bacterium]|nr:DUF2877 domain-containing protein [Deltaproteobacteria bacterium]